MKKRHSTVLQKARSKKNNTLIEKTILALKTAQRRVAKCLKPKKTNTLIEKTILALKTLQIHVEKRYSTVLQNAWSQKNKHSNWKNNSGLKNTINSYENNGTAPSYKMPEAKKNNHFHWKNNSCLPKTYTIIWKTAQPRLTKCLKPKNQSLSLKNTSVLKNTINSCEKTAQHRLAKCLRPKKQTLSLKEKFGFKKLI